MSEEKEIAPSKPILLELDSIRKDLYELSDCRSSLEQILDRLQSNDNLNNQLKEVPDTAKEKDWDQMSINEKVTSLRKISSILSHKFGELHQRIDSAI
jgi:uncharacterized coiled-coil DUF342 family protein